MPAGLPRKRETAEAIDIVDVEDGGRHYDVIRERFVDGKAERLHSISARNKIFGVDSNHREVGQEPDQAKARGRRAAGQ